MVGKKTALEFVNTCLVKLNLDQVASFTDTQEAQTVLGLLNDAKRDIERLRPWPFLATNMIQFLSISIHANQSIGTATNGNAPGSNYLTFAPSTSPPPVILSNVTQMYYNGNVYSNVIMGANVVTIPAPGLLAQATVYPGETVNTIYQYPATPLSIIGTLPKDVFYINRLYKLSSTTNIFYKIQEVSDKDVFHDSYIAYTPTLTQEPTIYLNLNDTMLFDDCIPSSFTQDAFRMSGCQETAPFVNTTDTTAAAYPNLIDLAIQYKTLEFVYADALGDNEHKMLYYGKKAKETLDSFINTGAIDAETGTFGDSIRNGRQPYSGRWSVQSNF